MKPYYERDGITIYHGDVFDVIDAVESFDALITDPPYSSGGTFRSDRAARLTQIRRRAVVRWLSTWRQPRPANIPFMDVRVVTPHLQQNGKRR